MPSFLDAAELELPCDKCGGKTKKSIRWIKTHNQFTCRCGQVINFAADQFRSEIAKAERSIAALQAELKKLSK